jgi:hypothetical protein
MRKFRSLIICLVLLVSAGSAYARLADYMKLGRIPDYGLGIWAYGDGNQSMSMTICAASSNYNNAFKDPPPVKDPPAVHELYDYKVKDRNGPAGFFLYLDNNDANTGNAKLAVRVEHRDTKDGNSWETLADNVYDSHSHTGQFRNCKNGRNSEMRISISAAELEQARAGPYRARLEATGRGGSSGTKKSRRRFNADITVSDIVRVTGLANISLGTYTGGSDINVEESFCVYSNNDTAAYTVTITSPNQDGAGNFLMVNGAATESIAYTLYFKDNLAPGVGTQVAAPPIPGSGNNSASNCGGADNAKLSVNVLSVDMGPVSSDTYSDTLTVRVAPQ